MFTRWNDESLTAYENKVSALLSSLRLEDCHIHFGKSNTKTHMLNEGTSAGPVGTCDCSCRGDCYETCYAVVHGDGIYTACRQNHAENTIIRRSNPTDYYKAFFTEAYRIHRDLRVNETGDFETEADILALLSVAKLFPSVRVIGYTKRTNLLPYVAELNRLPNVTIHYSLACNGIGKAEAEKYGVPVTKITFDKSECNCPVQLLKLSGKDGEWHCSDCAKNGCGCFAKRNVNFLAH